MNNLTKLQLKLICKTNNIKGYSKYRKADLINYINSFNLNINRQVNEFLKNKPNQCKTTTKYKNNEAFGITCEYVTCNLYGLENNLKDRIITRNN